MPESVKKKKRLFLIDGSALAYRSYFAFIRNPLINSKGEDTSAAYGFTSSILKLLREENPEYIGVVFDTKAPTFRHEIYKEYKSTRAKMPEEMVCQLPRIVQLVEGLNIPILEMERYEADDLMGTLARKAKEKGLEVILVTGDKDFMQLVDEDIKVLNPRKSGEEIELYNKKKVKEKFGVPPEKVTDLLGLMGDTSDNVPGIPGVGEKTALSLIQQFGDLEGVLANADKVSKKNISQKLKEYANLARLSKKLVTIETEAPLDLDLKKLAKKEFNLPRLKELFKDLEFTRFLQEVTSSEKQDEAKYYTLNEKEELEKLLSRIETKKEFTIDTETTAKNPMESELVGISISLEKGEAYYIPLGHQQGKNLDLDYVIKRFKPILEDEKIKKVGQNLKFDLKVLKNYGICLRGIVFDTMIASHLLNPLSRQHNLSSLALEYLDYRKMAISDLIGTGKKQKSFATVPVETATRYSCEDADYTLRLKSLFEPRLEEHSLEKLFYEVEIPLIQVLADMEMNGISIDIEYLKEFSSQMDIELSKTVNQIYQLAGKEFNLNSPQQLSKVLFEDLKLSPIRKTAKKTIASTDFGVLEELAKTHLLPQKLLEYRQLYKLKSTYIDALPALVNKRTKRIHTSFNQTVTSTGRLSSSEPNLQNIPIKTEIGRRIRKGFIPKDENYLLLSADYSQIELRILAHFSGDEILTDSFFKNEDIHTRTASEVFGVPLDKITPDQRRQAKTANFAIIYGVSAYGLSQQTGMTTKEASMFIDIYFKRYPRVQAHMENLIEKARKDGYVTTLLGRRGYIPEINSPNRQKREFAERVAINMPHQGSAADLIKVVMIEVAKELAGKKSKMILQVHDELVFEVHKAELKEIKDMVRDKMENTVKLKVPVKVDISVGKNWLEESQ
ncbi:MAG: DNA polymerase I [candidate division Zixibacteria bacterium]|nr:DNA polymerase I [candidate division Zixibacteria bacterium]